MNVFLTGTSGLLGQRVLADLVFDNKVERVIALYRNKWIGYGSLNMAKVTFIRGDLRDPNLFSNLYASYGIDAVIHLGANAIVKNSERSISDTFHTNILGTVYLLEAAKNAKIDRFIYQSTDKVYGEQGEIKYNENSQLKGRNAYELSKVCADITAFNFNSFGLKTFCVRCCNMFGPGDLNFSRLIPSAIAYYLRNESPILYSDSVNRVREFINIKDVSNGINSILFYDGKERIFNLGSGYNNPIPGMFYYIYARAKNRLKDKLTVPAFVVKSKDVFFPEIDFQAIDYSLAASELGYVPTTTINIDAYMDETIDFYIKYFNYKE